jgi:L-fuconolactonase
MAAYLARLTAAHHPDTRIVIDHLGLLQPFEPLKPAEPWADLPKLRRIFDAFGMDRCMWGADWTRAVAFLTDKEGVDDFRLTDHLSDSDRATLMGGTVQKVYGWAPSPRQGRGLGGVLDGGIIGA